MATGAQFTNELSTSSVWLLNIKDEPQPVVEQKTPPPSPLVVGQQRQTVGRSSQEGGVQGGASQRASSHHLSDERTEIIEFDLLWPSGTLIGRFYTAAAGMPKKKIPPAAFSRKTTWASS